MRLRIQLLIISLCSVSSWALATMGSADDFFHGGAQRYLTNNIPGALEVVTNGLQQFPDDVKLKKLYELLNQQQKQQQQQQDQKQQDQDKKDQQKQDQKQDQKNQQEQKDQQSKNDKQKQDEQKKQQEAKDKKDQQAKSSDKSKDQPEEKKGEQVAAHAMTPQEAKQLLDAQKDDEQVLIFQPQGEPKNQKQPLKDW